MYSYMYNLLIFNKVVNLYIRKSRFLEEWVFQRAFGEEGKGRDSWIFLTQP